MTGNPATKVAVRLVGRVMSLVRCLPVRARVVLLAASIVAAWSGPLAVRANAQIGETTDILTGRVVGPDGKPMADVTVSATSAESGITRTKKTGDDGRYTILFPDGGGEYRVVFRAIGFQQVTKNIARQGDEDRLVADATVGVQVPTQLSTVNVTARRRNPAMRGQPPTPGEQGETLGAEELARLPVDQSDLAAVAALAPGVVPVPGTDSTDAAFSVAGQRSTLNNTTLDGLSFGSFSVPQEGLRSTRVVTNTYDPSRGQFSGGEIASTTRAGTNDLTGGVTYSRRDPTLEFEGTDSAAISPLFLQDQISAGLGGPIVKDKLFIFASGQFRRRSDPFQSLLAASPASLQSLGLEPDSVARFVSTVNALGLPTAAITPDRRIGDNGTALARMDWFLTDAHTLTLRGDWRRSTQNPTRTSPYALPTSSGTSVNTGSGLAATLTSYFESGIINELRAYYTRGHNEAAGYLALPSGRVRITSTLADGTQGVSVLTFGGNAGFPQTGTTTLLELADEVSYLTHDRAHRLRLGTLLDVNRFRQDVTTNRLGTFTYNSLDAFATGAPDSYTRSLLQQQRLGSTTSGAIYVGDTWTPTRRLQLVYGLRGEATHVGDAPPLNPEVEQLFGFRTNHFPGEVHVSPRAGFSLNLTKSDPNDPFSRFLPAFLIRGGIGEFRARTPTGLYTSAESATGLTNTEQQLTCIGDAVPTPDWASYAADPYATPVACATSTTPAPPSYATAARNVTVFDPDFEAPRSWRASLGVQHRLVGSISVSADASYARGVALYGVRDLNLNPTPAFHLADEGNRPVYAPAGAIVPASGQVSAAASRRYSQYGAVYELTSGLASDTRQLTLGLNGTTTGGTTYHLAYTLQRTNDQSSFTCCSAAQGFASPTTAGNPNVSEWSPGNMDIRHAIQGYVTYPIRSWFLLTANGRLTSGAPFTPMVGGDVNGDGARDDRAFVFDPANASDPRVAGAMQTLLQTAPSRVRDCLTRQLGTIAARNSCRGPWTPSLDMQANFIPQGMGLKGKATFSLVAANVLAGLDELLHGSNLRGWGQYDRADPTLLYVRGFDPATQRFTYDVNGRFGSNNVSRSVYRQPFVVALQARVIVGPDPRERFRRIFAQRTDTAARRAAVQNPIARLIGMRDTLHLSDDQVARLTVVSDTLVAATTAIATEIRAEVQKKGMNDPRAVMGIIRPYITRGRQALQAALTAAQGILTPEQWAKVPDDVKNPRGLGGFGGPRGGRGRGRPQ